MKMGVELVVTLSFFPIEFRGNTPMESFALPLAAVGRRQATAIVNSLVRPHH